MEVFKNSIIIVLRKPNKGDYTIIKTYKPVILFNIINKIIKLIIIRRINYLAEIYGLLLKTYLGGSKITSIKYIIYIFLK